MDLCCHVPHQLFALTKKLLLGLTFLKKCLTKERYKGGEGKMRALAFVLPPLFPGNAGKLLSGSWIKVGRAETPIAALVPAYATNTVFPDCFF